jgi:hypothetical protein
MEYQLAFSPQVELAAGEFVVAWNEEATSHVVAHASLTPGGAQSYNPLIDLVSLVLTNVGLGLGTNALYDLIKSVFAKKEPKKQIKITKLDQPDGTHVLVIEIEE